ncbi:carbohydrate deacetylase [Natronogracilivirga saccharolytica]|uniref:ChbG/HpnK family deacetylase n=1 Tax=Natronogracilivirga saccharolytica TaxID=2812953 RepID=A0A8J7RNL8_9BACT|nr:ChbG/HpnK family deacetylase [Natronogracilivirga saccharolytica]MBP3193338.1 ChbG/HpnK family deacetylase [Natronogracilivirga saccharolytica]
MNFRIILSGKTGFLLLLIFLAASLTHKSSAGESGDGPAMLIRADDMGMSHGQNQAFRKLIETGMPLSVSVMFACPWWKQAVEILEEHPDVSVGVHLTLNAEWKHYRWGPVLGRSAVPSLVNDQGYFFPSRALLYDNDPQLDEIEAELRAQVQRAVDTGLQIDYLDYHMGAAVETPETRAVVEQIAADYDLAISRWFGEDYSNITYSAPIGSKTDSLVSRINRLDSDAVNLQVVHIAPEQSDMNDLIDLNEFGLSDMAGHRYHELQALLSPEFREALEQNQVRLVTYRDVVREMGLDSMERPEIYKD